MPAEGSTGLVIPAPSVDALLLSVALRYPGAVREGVPAHVSLLYPFIPVIDLDETVYTALRQLFAKQPSMSIKFSECRRRNDFVYLHPEPLSELVNLTNKVQRLWPNIVPYRGLYKGVEPHLTIAMGTSEETAHTIQSQSGPTPKAKSRPAATRRWARTL